MFSITLLCANRFTCVVCPVWHHVFWNKRTNTSIFISVFLPICFTWHLAIARTKVNVYNGEGLLDYDRVVPKVRTTYFKFFISATVFIFIVISLILSFRKLSKFKKRVKSVEVSLTFATCIICFMFLIYIIIQAILMIFSTQFLVDNLEFGSYVMKLQFICNDFYLISSPIALLVMSKRLRVLIFGPSMRRSSSILDGSSTNGKVFPNLAKQTILIRNKSEPVRF